MPKASIHERARSLAPVLVFPAALALLGPAIPALADERCPSSTGCIADTIVTDDKLWRVTFTNNCGYTVKISICFKPKSGSGYRNCKSGYYVAPGKDWRPFATIKRHTGDYNFAASRQECPWSLRKAADLTNEGEQTGVKQGKAPPAPPPQRETPAPGPEQDPTAEKKTDDKAIVEALVPKKTPAKKPKDADPGPKRDETTKPDDNFERGLVEADKRKSKENGGDTRKTAKKVGVKPKLDPLVAWRRREVARCRAARQSIRVGVPSGCECHFSPTCGLLVIVPKNRPSKAERARRARQQARHKAQCERRMSELRRQATTKRATEDRKVRSCLARVTARYEQKKADRGDANVKFD